MLAVTPTLRGQYIFAPSGARSAGMGDCGVALYDLHSATLNIAAAARIGEPQIALAYRQDFMLSELAYKSITGSYTFRRHRASGGSTSAIPYGTLPASLSRVLTLKNVTITTSATSRLFGASSTRNIASLTTKARSTDLIGMRFTQNTAHLLATH